MEVYARQIHVALWNSYVSNASFETLIFANLFNSWVWEDRFVVSLESLGVTEVANRKLKVQPSSRTLLILATIRQL